MEKETGREKIKGVTACTACQRIARRCSASRRDGGNGRREVVLVADGVCNYMVSEYLSSRWSAD